MYKFIKHEQPRRNADGRTSVYCRKCGREIARRGDSQIRSIGKCAICVLEEQGVENAEDYVTPRYVQTDPNKPPIPWDAEGTDSVFVLFPEERPEEGYPVPPSGGIMGTAKSVFRALGLVAEKLKPSQLPKSRQIANRQRASKLYD